MHLAVRGFTARPLEIRQGGRVLWSGQATEALRWIELPAVAVARGRAQLELASPSSPVRESIAEGARALGFAVYGVRVE